MNDIEKEHQHERERAGSMWVQPVQRTILSSFSGNYDTF